MEVRLWLSSKIKIGFEEEFQSFVGGMMKRLVQGYARYGRSKKEQRYMTRLGLELKAYKKTGNAEHLLNIANYAILESVCPENRKFHFDAKVDSVTRTIINA